MVLALLPAENIVDNAREIYAAASDNTQQIFRAFNEYYKRQRLWRENPQSFSVYGQLKRTKCWIVQQQAALEVGASATYMDFH